MNFNRITDLGMEKVAANPKDLGQKALSKLKGLSKKQVAGLAGAGGLAAGAAGKVGYDRLSDEQKENLKHRLKGTASGAAEGALGGTLGGYAAGNRGVNALKGSTGMGAALGGALGAVSPNTTSYGVLKKHREGKEKQASAEELYIDGLQKIASVTGIEPEVLDEAIGVYNEEMTKEAEVNNFLDSISEEEAGEILKEAAQSSPELKGKISELEEQEENEELGTLVSTIEGMSDEDAKKLLEEIE